MKKNISIVISVLSCILVVVSLFEINILQNRIDSFEDHMSSDIDSIQNSISNITYNVESAITSGNSLISSKQFFIGDLDLETLTVPVTFTVVPKEYSQDTVVELVSNGKLYTMEYSDGELKCTVDVSAFSSINIENITFTSGNKISNEPLTDFSVNVKERIFPEIHSQFSSSSEIYTKDGNLIYSCKGDFEVDISSYDELDPNIKLKGIFAAVNGEQTERFPINTDVIDKYYTHGYNYINHQFTVPANSHFELYSETVDEYGLIHKNVVYSLDTDENGNLKGDMNSQAESITHYILDSDRNVLYEGT